MSATTTPETHVAAYRETVEQVLAALQSDGERGLSEAEAQKRLENIARNELAAEDAVPAWRRFLAQFTDVLVVLLRSWPRQLQRGFGSMSANQHYRTKRSLSSASWC